MLNYLLFSRFEQNNDNTLPKDIEKIVRRIANQYSVHTATARQQQRNQELAHAILHMKLYQKRGLHSIDSFEPAFAYLDQLMSPSDSTTRSIFSTVKPAHI